MRISAARGLVGLLLLLAPVLLFLGLHALLALHRVTLQVTCVPIIRHIFEDLSHLMERLIVVAVPKVFERQVVL